MYRRRLLGTVGVLSGVSGIEHERLTQLVEPRHPQTVHQFSGERGGFSDAFRLADGVTTVDIEHTGESAVGVELVETNSTAARALLTDDTGQTTGTVFIADSGEYRFGVTTAGPWAIECTQPAVESVEHSLPPQTTAARGSSYTEPLLLNRTTELTATHAGSGAFRLTGYTEAGDSQQLLDKTGETEHWTTTDLSGMVWFAVEAAGDWRLEVF